MAALLYYVRLLKTTYPLEKKEKEDYKNPTNPLSFKIKNSQGVVEDVLVIRISGVISIFKLIFKHFIQNIADV